MFRVLRLVAALFLLLPMLLLTTSPAHAATATVGDIRYEYDPTDIDAGATASDYLGSGGALTIPDTVELDGNTYDVNNISAYAAYGKNLTSLAIGNNVSTIGWGAFQDNQISSLTIPDHVTSIGGYAFDHNSIESLDLGTGVTSIDIFAFQVNQLTEVTIPSQITDIGDWAFNANHGLTSVDFTGPAPTMNGFVFAGSHPDLLITYPWRYGADVVGAGGYTTPTWTGNNYPAQAIATVTFDTFGGTPAPADQEVVVGGTITEPTPPSKPGFPFLGWSTDAAHTTPFNVDTDTIDGDTTLYANYGDIEYTYNPANPGAGATAHEYHGAGGALTIPDTVELEGDTYDVVAVGDWFAQDSPT